MNTAQTDPDASLRRHTVGVLGKAIDVIEVLTFGEPRTIREIADETGIEKAAVYRILNTLEERGFATKDERSKRYAPGPRLVIAATALLRDHDAVSVARPVMVRLRDEFGETVNLGVLTGQNIEYLEIVESPHSLRMSAEVGSTHPAHATALGKAALAELDPESLERQIGHNPLQPATRKTLADRRLLTMDLAQVRDRGFAIDDEENELGAVCVAVALPHLGYGTRHAMSVSGPATRMSADVIGRIGRRLVEVSGELGAVPV
ncbi:transcriptional regulator, TrmB [Beutenbergia cavernae DSM 12333]|uniref:Transcriptional regulator, TrmB n=1 Tax=Beutenbergia cavernae (strain ATCC BAA-8 / DSM 12333 / CCUG 43141 / JCM 11478 / NBRC 16432 / NCIMB 13614 / HKI 0122) TaxID=471853 RepID=C5C2N4_BEUC1|nr:IclR family transcriptional regulator [Beutenbergia cavernae]ACQ79720.1 transcriptional regulator, TrmB [Beutenbergia cavernae DSM 12333]